MNLCRAWPFAGILAILAAGGWVASQPGARPDPGRTPEALIQSFAGTKAVTRPSLDAVMGFPLPTRVEQVLVRGGEAVKAGQLMVRGDDAEDLHLIRLQQIRAESVVPVEKARKAFELATLEYDRLRDAMAKGGANQQEVDRARLTAESTKLDLDAAEQNQAQERIQLERMQSRLEKLRLAAPFDGIVDMVFSDPGNSVSEQDKVIRVVRVDPFVIDVPAPTEQTVALALEVSSRAWVLVKELDRVRVMEGVVTEVSPVADAASRTRRVRVEVRNPPAAPVVVGEPAWVRFEPPTDEWRTHAASSLADRGGPSAGSLDGGRP